MPSSGGRAPCGSPIFNHPRMQRDNDALLRHARATTHPQTQRLPRRASDLVSSTAIARWRQLPLKTSSESKAWDVDQFPCGLREGGHVDVVGQPSRLRRQGRRERRKEKEEGNLPHMEPRNLPQQVHRPPLTETPETHRSGSTWPQRHDQTSRLGLQ